MERASLFEKRREEVRKHNLRPEMSWVAVVNKFADHTDLELRGMLGNSLSQRRGPVSLLQAMPPMLAPMLASQTVAASVDYRTSLNMSVSAKDQGGCGSCWAVAAAGAMETHAEMLGGATFLSVSYEELVDCVQNLQECGGTGGCSGATSELAFDYITKNGIALMSEYTGYQSGGDGQCRPPTNKAMTATSFVRVEPDNDAAALQNAIASQGPAVVSADATNWMNYGGGVFKGCESPDVIINHAILMMGYGHDSELDMDFWIIRNSWGPTWGERGYIRLFKQQDGTEYCGVDQRPLDGVACRCPAGLECDNDPPATKVCGMCGILSDSAYPTGVKITGV